jgi:hypothetical protein
MISPRRCRRSDSDAQRSNPHTLAEEARQDVEDDLTKAKASKKIDDLQEKTGRGSSTGGKTRGAVA